MEIWPSILPDPTVDFSGAVNAGVLRTSMDNGLARQRRKTISEIATFTTSWEMNDDEFTTFRAWHAEKINLGVDWFVVNLPFGGGLMPQIARFVSGNFSAKMLQQDNYTVSASLEVVKPTRLAEGTVDCLLDPVFMSEFSDFETAIANLFTFIHTTLPSQYA